MFELCFLSGLLLAAFTSLGPEEKKTRPGKEGSPHPREASRKGEIPRSTHRTKRRQKSGNTDIRSISTQKG